jgi:hypothetical protein
MRIAYDNIVDRVTTSSIVASSALTNNPILNVTDQRLSTRWISDTTTSQSVVVEMPVFPEYPDNATGTTYINANFTGSGSPLDGWTAVTCDLTTVGGKLIVTNTGNNPRINRAVTAEKTYRFKVTKISGNGTRVAVRNTSGTIFNITKDYGSESTIIHDAYIGSGATGFVNLEFGSDEVTIGARYEVDFIYIGDGTYSSLALDASGNGNHGTVYGATPVAGISGKALSFDGVNDRVEKTGYYHSGDVFCISAWVKRTPSTTGVWIGTGNAEGLYLESYNDLGITAWSQKADGTNVNFSFGNVLSTTEFKHVVAQINLTTGAYSGYVNGVLVVSGSHSSAMKQPANNALRLGNGAAWGGTIDDPRIYNRALSQAEITSLYNNEPFASEMLGLVGWWKLDKDYHVNTAAILGHNIKSGTTVKIEANNSNVWGAPELSETFSFVASDATILRFLSEVKVYKYWRFSFTGQASVQAGRLWLGEYLQVNPSSLLDLTVSKKRSDVVVYGRDRQKFANPGVGWRQVSAKFPKTNPNMIYRLEQFHDHVGNHSSFIFCNFDTSREFPLVEPLYGSLSDNLSFNHTDRQKYTYSLNIEEDK